SGQATITASSGSISGSTTTLHVQAAVVTSIAVTPNPAATGVGIARQLTAIGTFSDGSTANINSTATWTSSGPSVRTVSGGLASGVAPGATSITAALDGVSGTTTLTVTSHAWTPTGAMATPRGSHTATLLGNGKVLAAGGNYGINFAGAEIYDPITSRWSPA